ncbi:MAG TPA: glycosyltransferase family 2 protein, partial [Pyrinomonadaceae bacterium]|nr:glycosyltransferase family 2 protein [Pyrinomonadaceae bacterium]
KAGWGVDCELSLTAGGEHDVVWILAPKQHEPLAQAGMKVSIIMPTYRRSHTLYRTVRSIQRQSYSNWELIIIDNEGTAGYRFDDPRISVRAHAEWTSASYARNQGLSYATGDLVCFFDDDDDMFPEYLEKFVNVFATNPQVKMVRCGMIVSAGQTNFSYATPECCLRREFATPTWASHTSSHDQLYFRNIIATCGWSESNGDIINLPEPLCRANCDPHGGLRSGRL